MLPVALWLCTVAAAAWIVAQARYVTDLSAFLPASPTPLQQVLVDQLRDGPASRLILIALEGGDPAARARISSAMARRLRPDPAFTSIDNGGILPARTEDFVFRHRYLLSDAVTAQHFSAEGLRSAIEETIEGLASSGGLLLKPLATRDPTGETLHIADRLSRNSGPRVQDGAWVSADGRRTLLAAQTAAAGSDTDAQERDLEAIRTAFRGGVDGARGAGGAPDIRLRMSGPGVFAVSARAQIKHAATRLSIAGALLVVAVLLAVYRSISALALGLIPVATGAVVGIAAVALGFGAVHGLTLGFGITLIGESVDYSIYFFVQSMRGGAADSGSSQWQRSLWPTVRLGMLTSMCGFASLLPSAFPGLAQLGLYSIGGLAAAGLVTRFVLPELLPAAFTIRDVSPFGVWVGRRRDAARRAGFASGIGACVLALAAAGVLYVNRATLWDQELSHLSPLSAEDQRYDAMLRADLGAPDVPDLIVVTGRDREAALQGAERAAATLRTLVDAGVLGGFDTPADYLPSAAAQRARRSALPPADELERHLRDAAARLDVRAERLQPFLDDVQAARRDEPVTADDLRGTSLATGFDALMLQRRGSWNALLPLYASKGAGPPAIDAARIASALSAAGSTDAVVLDLKAQADALYASYLHEAIRLSLGGFALIALLLWTALRSPRRAVRVLAPLVLAVLTVASVLALSGARLTILHLVGMLLIVAVGSNYALFFDGEASAQGAQSASLTLASLCIANFSTVVGFGLLSFSRVPVLVALGQTVAPGALLALVFSALLTSRVPPAPAALRG